MAQERWRLSVDRQACQGTGMCASVAEEHFVVRGGTAEPINDEIDPADDVIDAADGCPVEAIRVVSTVDGRLVAPEPY